MIAYWKLDEKNDGNAVVFKDSSYPGNHTYDPQKSIIPKSVQQLVEFKEVYHLLCSDG